MFTRFTVLLVFLIHLCGSLHGQSVHRKHLLSSIGAGAGTLDMDLSVDSLTEQGLIAGTVRLAFAYAIKDRWSLGIHYDRIGTNEQFGAVDRVRFTTYMLEGIWRPWIGERAALEAQIGFGASIMALRTLESKLPYHSGSTVVSIGARYLHLVTETMGAYLVLEQAASTIGTVTLDETDIADANGEPITMQWRSPRISAGLLVRF